MRWGVPDGTRDSATGELVRDDDLMTSAICHALDKRQWHNLQSSILHSLLSLLVVKWNMSRLLIIGGLL
jgi:hypothetical protein